MAAHEASKAKKRFLDSPSAAILRQSAPGNLTSLLNMFERKPHSITSQLLSRIAKDGPRINTKEIANIKVPTLIIGNGDDYIHPMLLADNLTATVPGAKRVVITSKNVDEAAYVTEFRTALSGFLNDLK